jgi:hypothetical protein
MTEQGNAGFIPQRGLFRGGGTRRVRGLVHTRAKWVDEGHGRIETRRCVVAEAPAGVDELARWPGLKTLLLAESIREINGKASVERRYYLSSRQADAGHTWGWSCAGTGASRTACTGRWTWLTAKDQEHMRAGNAAANFSILCRITLNLIRLDKARKTGIKNCRLKAGYRQNCSVCKTQLGAIVLPVAECEIWLGFSGSENTPRG